MYTSKELLLLFLSSKARDWSLIWWVPAWEPKREVLPWPLTLLRLHECDQEPRDHLITTSVADWYLLISPTGNSPVLPLVRIKRPGSSSSSRCQMVPCELHWRALITNRSKWAMFEIWTEKRLVSSKQLSFGLCLNPTRLEPKVHYIHDILIYHYHLQTKLREGNVFRVVCLSTGWSLYDVTSCLAPWSHVPSRWSLSLVPCSFHEVSLSGRTLCRGVSV